MTEQPVDLVTALAEVMAAELWGDVWVRLASISRGNQIKELEPLIRAVLASGLVRPAADSVPRQAVLDLAKGLYIEAALINGTKQKARVKAYAAALRALTEETDRA